MFRLYLDIEEISSALRIVGRFFLCLNPSLLDEHYFDISNIKTDMFERFVLHYGFECEFCNPAQGNEKGYVENIMKYVRNNFLLPAQMIADLEDFNQTLWILVEGNRNRLHYEKEMSLTVLHEETRAAHILLPEKPFYCAQLMEKKTDKSGLIHLETKIYSTSPRFVQKKVLMQITYNEVRILDED